MVALSFNVKAQYASPSVVCYGENIYLFCGGLFGCGEIGSNYTWTDASGAWTSNDLNPVITPGSPGYHSGQFYLAVQYLPNGVSSGVASIFLLNPFYVPGTVTPVSCFGGSNGAISIAPDGGQPDYLSYFWSNGATTMNIAGLNAGTYSVTVTDANYCTATNSFIVSQPAGLTITKSGGSNVTCYGASNGSISVSVTGGYGAYTYLWNNGVNLPTIYNLSAGFYTVTVKDYNLCTKIQNYEITQPTALSGNGIVTNVSCYGGNNGVATINGLGGTPPYSYLWSTGANTPTITGLGIGRYYVTITDSHNCISYTWQDITQPSDMTVTGTPVNFNCQGSGTGQITTTVSGGSGGPLTYVWNNGQTGATATNLSAGSYTVTVTNGAGCKKTKNFSVTPLTFGTVSVLNATCSNTNNGSIQVVVNGGLSPYSYQWSNGQTSGIAVNLAAGVYTVTVTDAGFCTKIGSWLVTSPSAMSINQVVTNLSCNGSSTGKIDITVNGGTPGYAYKWNVLAYQGQGTSHIAGLYAGTYTVTVTDQNTCVKIQSWQVTQPSALSSNGTVTNITCYGGNNGSAMITAAGGTPPYYYRWSTGSTAPFISGLTIGRYYVTLTDAGSCSNFTFLNITQPTDITITGTPFSLSCQGSNTGKITTTVSGGSGGVYTYRWNNGQTGSTATNLLAGTYTVTVTNTAGCSKSQSFAVAENLPIIVSAASIQHASCYNSNNGYIQLSVTGGVYPYTYLWNNGQNTNTASFLTRGIYTVTVTDGGLCAKVGTWQINAPSDLSITPVVTNLLCNGGLTGKIDIVVSGGSAPYTYRWNVAAYQGQGTPHVFNLSAGPYTVTVTDQNTCMKIESYLITQPSALSTNGQAKYVTCYGGNNGSATFSGFGGTPPYTYRWSTGSTFQSISGLTAGRYYVTVSDANSCVNLPFIEVLQPSELTITGTIVKVTCFGGNDGKVTAIVTGGMPGYAYKWNNYQTTPAIVNLTAGAYTVTVTDFNTCMRIQSFMVNSNPAITLTRTGYSNPLCNAGNDGWIEVMAAGGLSGYSYRWNNGQNNAKVTGLSAGTYQVVVTDAGSCMATGSWVVTAPAALSIISSTYSNIKCRYNMDGKIDITVGGGSGSYTYYWESLPDPAYQGQYTPHVSHLEAGIYTVTVTDANNCRLIRSWLITQPSSLSGFGITTNVTCHGGSNGTATISGAGGTPPYTYRWITGSPGQFVSGLSTGFYSVTITDANSCMNFTGQYIGEPSEITILGTVTTVTCFGGSNGTITTSTSGGTPGYSYMWSNGKFTSAITGLIAGTYTVTVKDVNQCSMIKSFMVNSNTALSVTRVAYSNPLCNGSTDGWIQVSTAGGIGGYSYLWSNGQNSAKATGLTAGTYQVVVRDAGSCTITESWAVTAPPALSFLATSYSNVKCNDHPTGTIDITVGGGTGSYSYYWYSLVDPGTQGQGTPHLNSLDAGTYFVTVTDANNCKLTRSWLLTQPTKLSGNGVVTDVSCHGGNNGTATISGAGGTPPYNYKWITGSPSQLITGLTVGFYPVTITDANSCMTFTGQYVSEPSEITVVGVPTKVTCFGGSNGTITTTVTGGTPGYAYLWNNGKSTPAITGLTAGTYTVTVKDAHSCTMIKSFTVISNLKMIITRNGYANPTCFTSNNGWIQLSVTGGLPYYTYLWNNGATTPTISGLIAGSYTVVVTDAGGCTETGSWALTQPAMLSGNGVVSNVTCFGGSNGAATISGFGGTAPYTYKWSTGATTQTITGLVAGSYAVTITDFNNCLYLTSRIITQPTEIIITGTPVMVTCFGGNNGKITTTVSGGTGGMTYRWNNGQTTSSIINLTAGIYTVTVTDASLCAKIGYWQIISPAALSLTSIKTNVLCNGGATGKIDVTVVGGTPAYSYYWNVAGNQGQGTPHVYALTAGVYTVTVADQNSCAMTQSWLITQPVALSANSVGTNVTCYGGNNGTATIAGSGGTAPYIYKWSTGSTASTITGLIAGRYYVSVTDAHYCFIQTWQDITQPSNMSINYTATMVTCQGLSNGKITTTVSGGSGGSQTYLWNNGQTGSTATNLTAGTYTVTVTNSAGCKLSSAPIIVGTAMLLPGAAGVITGPVVVTQGQTGVAYSVAPIANATGYYWTLPTGASIASGSNTASITVNYSATASSGSINVYGTNLCGNGATSPNLDITVNSLVPTNLTLQNISLGVGTYCYNALQTIYVAGVGTLFTVNSGASVTMVAGLKIIYQAGTTVKNGSYMHGYITTTGQYCPPSNPVVNNPVQVGDVQTSVPEFVKNQHIRAYPNPTNDAVTLELSGTVETGMTKVEIYGMNGVKVLSKVLIGERKHTFTLETLRPGIYFIHVTTGGTLETMKLIKL